MIAKKQDLQDELVLEVGLLKEFKDAAAAASLRAEEQEQVVLNMMEGAKTRKAGAFRITRVAAQRVKYNEAGLKKAIGARLFNKLTKPAPLDTKKLDEAVQEGLVDINVVAQYATITENKPYVRISDYVEDDLGDE